MPKDTITTHSGACARAHVVLGRMAVGWLLGFALLLTACFAPDEDASPDATTGTGEADECPEGVSPNACGGCEPLGADLDAACGACDTGRFACVDEEAACVGDLGAAAPADACGPDALCLDGSCHPLAPCSEDADCPQRAGYACLDGRCELPSPLACLPVTGRIADPSDATRPAEVTWQVAPGEAFALRVWPEDVPGTGPWSVRWEVTQAPEDAEEAPALEATGDAASLTVELSLDAPGSYAFALTSLIDAEGIENCVAEDELPEVLVTVLLTCGEDAPVDLDSDPRHCGDCGNSCDLPNAESSCVAGRCSIDTCEPSHASCDGDAATGCEAHLADDPNHCGDCGRACGDGHVCAEGQCVQEESWPAAWAALESAAIEEVNRVRAAGATCAGTPHDPAPALTLHPSLEEAARAHSLDMGTRGFYSHTNPSGENMMQRVQAAGYEGVPPIVENLGAGHATAVSMVNGWISNVGHCVGLMNPSTRHVGIGYALVEGSPHVRYWTFLAGSGP